MFDFWTEAVEARIRRFTSINGKTRLCTLFTRCADNLRRDNAIGEIRNGDDELRIRRLRGAFSRLRQKLCKESLRLNNQDIGQAYEKIFEYFPPAISKDEVTRDDLGVEPNLDRNSVVMSGEDVEEKAAGHEHSVATVTAATKSPPEKRLERYHSIHQSEVTAKEREDNKPLVIHIVSSDEETDTAPLPTNASGQSIKPGAAA